ncbi:MAG: glycosyltransferase family 2 protein [Planctomycetota bacterium]
MLSPNRQLERDRPGPTLSIGLPVYNGENYLEQAVRSLLAQTFTDFELILCDNASTDRTRSICEAFARDDPRVRYVQHETNQGLIRNFNHAFEVARGVYFKWMAHDDLIDPEFTGRCIQELQRDDSIAVCATAVQVIDAEGFTLEDPEPQVGRHRDPLGMTQLHDRPGSERGLDHSHPRVRHRGVLLKSIRCYEEFGVIRSAALRRTPLREYYPGSEKVMLTELSLIGSIKVLPEPLMYMRVHDDRLSSQSGSGDRRALYLAPSPHRRGPSLPPQARCAWGYWRTIWRQPLTLRNRVGCAWNFVRFLLQVRKWVAVLRIALLNQSPVVSAPALTRGPRIGADQATEPTTPPARTPQLTHHA